MIKYWLLASMNTEKCCLSVSCAMLPSGLQPSATLQLQNFGQNFSVLTSATVSICIILLGEWWQRNTCPWLLHSNNSARSWPCNFSIVITIEPPVCYATIIQWTRYKQKLALYLIPVQPGEWVAISVRIILSFTATTICHALIFFILQECVDLSFTFFVLSLAAYLLLNRFTNIMTFLWTFFFLVCVCTLCTISW